MWTWVDFQNGNTAQKTDVALGSGNHVLKLIGNEPGVGIDKIIITDDMTCTPTGLGSNCAQVPTTTITSMPPTTTPTPSITLTPTPQAQYIVSFDLYDGNTGGQLNSLGNNSIIATSPERKFFISANTSPRYVGSVKFEINGSLQRIDSTSPYDSHDGATGFWTPAAGEYTVKATPYSGVNATGTAGIPLSVLVTVREPNISPTTSVTPSNTKANVTLLLHGIGKGGDNANSASTGNLNPLREQRPVQLFIYDSNNSLLSSPTGTVTYNATTGNFKGTVDIGAELSTGQYLVKVKSPSYLRGSIPGIITLTKGSASTLTQVSLVSGDANDDNSLNILDYNLLLDCYADLAPAKNCDTAKKTATDFSDDGSVNQFDYNLFLRELSVQSGQ